MPLLRSPLLQGRSFSHAFPTRDTADAELLEALGLVGRPGADITTVVQLRQVHGSRVVEVGNTNPGSPFGAPTGGLPEGDALVARAGAPRVAVGVRVADCVPVLVADERSGDVAAIHAGWRGVVAGVVPAAISALLSRRTAEQSAAGDAGGAERLVAAIGPCIGPCCFEVGRDVAARTGFVAREAGEKAYVDLRAAVRAQLTSGRAEERAHRRRTRLHETRARAVSLLPPRRRRQPVACLR